MTNETQLIYPTLDLFLYDLRKGLGQSDDKLNQKRRNFWQQIYGENLDDTLLEKLAKVAVETDYQKIMECVKAITKISVGATNK